MVDDERKAYHEAGHGAVAFHEGIGVDFITIKEQIFRGRPVLGLCQWEQGIIQRRDSLEHSDPDSWRILVDKMTAFVYGGMIAEFRYNREHGKPEFEGSIETWQGDLDKIKEYTERRFDTEEGQRKHRNTIGSYVTEVGRAGFSLVRHRSHSRGVDSRRHDHRSPCQGVVPGVKR